MVWLAVDRWRARLPNHGHGARCRDQCRRHDGSPERAARRNNNERVATCPVTDSRTEAGGVEFVGAVIQPLAMMGARCAVAASIGRAPAYAWPSQPTCHYRHCTVVHMRARMRVHTCCSNTCEASIGGRARCLRCSRVVSATQASAAAQRHAY